MIIHMDPRYGYATEAEDLESIDRMLEVENQRRIARAVTVMVREAEMVEA